MHRILNKEQAAAVYAAMVYLNNVGGRLHARMPDQNSVLIHVTEHVDGEIQVFYGDSVGNPAGMFESYEGQLVFAELHGVL